MRRLFCALLLSLAAALAAAAEPSPREQWQTFQNEMKALAAGPTGMYAAQDMQEINPGDAVHLPATGDLDALRWKKGSASGALLNVKYEGGKVSVTGQGVPPQDLQQAKDRTLSLPNGLIVRVSTLHDQTLKMWLYNPKLPAKRGFKGLAFFPYDARGEVQGTFHPKANPEAVSYIDSREQNGKMYDVGTLTVQIAGKPYELRTMSYKKDWKEIDALLVLLKDRTSGKTTYGGGRVVEVPIPAGQPPQTLTLNLNMAYSFLCAHSNFYNCPLVLTTFVDTPLEYGEKYPPL
jgi:uncharacterized protein (DUF1684 family)